MSECTMTKSGLIEMLKADIEALDKSNVIQPEKTHIRLVLQEEIKKLGETKWEK